MRDSQTAYGRSLRFRECAIFIQETWHQTMHRQHHPRSLSTLSLFRIFTHVCACWPHTHTQRNKPWLHLTVFHQMALLQIAFLDLKRAFVMPVTLQCEPLSYNFGAFRQCSCVWLPGLLYDLWSLHFRSLTLLNFDFLQRSGSCL